jgi:hypothetical protein
MDDQQKNIENQNIDQLSQSNNEIKQEPQLPSENENSYNNVISSSIPEEGLYKEVNNSSAVPMVAVSSQNKQKPKWFYFIFILTVIIFITICILLGMIVLNKKSNTPKQISNPTPTPTKALISTPTPTMILEVQDPILIQLRTLSDSDEIDKIKEDLSNTKITVIDDSLSLLDKSFNFIPVK